MQASYLHDKALQTLFRGDNRVSKLYNCSNKPVNASEERLVSQCCTVFFYLGVLLHLFCTINTLHVGVDYLIIFYYAEYWGGGGGENFFGGVDILFEGVIANIGGVAPPCPPPPPPPQNPSMVTRLFISFNLNTFRRLVIKYYLLLLVTIS